MAAVSDPSWRVASRVAAGVLGAYAFAWGFVALGAMLLFAAGLDYYDASSLALMLAFLVYLASFCWAFVSRSVARAWAVLAGGGAAMTLAGWLLSLALA